MVEVERSCNVCNEEASLFCRMCKQHCCWEHLCSHLAIAHEDNTYTQRLGDAYEDSAIRDGNTEQESPTSFNSTFNGENILPLTKQTIQSYSETELHRAYDYHRAQTRRIRAELERRALFDSGVVPTIHLSGSYYEKELRRNSIRARSRSLGKGASASFDLLLNQLRKGYVSLEYIKCKLEHFSK